MDLAANLGIATATPFTDLYHYTLATLYITTSNFGPYVATVNTFGGRYTQRNVVWTGFSNHLVVKPSKNPFNLATTFGFSDLEPSDGD